MFLGVMAAPRRDWVPDGSGAYIDLDVLVSGQHHVK